MKALLAVLLVVYAQSAYRTYTITENILGTQEDPAVLKEWLTGEDEIEIWLEYIWEDINIWQIQEQSNGLRVWYGNYTYADGKDFQKWYIRCDSDINCNEQYVDLMNTDNSLLTTDDWYLRVEINNQKWESGIILSICQLLLLFLFLI